jgi:hypothetical protein
MRRDGVTDLTPQVRQVGEAISYDTGAFVAGFLDAWSVRFPTRLEQPIGVYSMDLYLQDAWQIRPNLTLTAGIRVEHNSNPVCQTNCFSNLASSFSSLPTASTTPYDLLFAGGRHRAFLKQQAVGVDPRFGFAWLPSGTKTTVRGGFGMFTDVFPSEIASDLLINPPTETRFTVYGYSYGNNYTVATTDPKSASAAAISSNTAFQAAYPTGGSYSSISTATGGTFRRPSISATNPKVFLPTTEEWSLAVERQLDSKTAVSASYIGNHSYHGAVTTWPNAYQAGFTGLPSSIPNGSVGTTALYTNGNKGNYNGLLLTAKRTDKYVLVELNYTYSHTLDLVSNGGFNAFGNNPIGQQNPANLSYNYGNADYNQKHYLSAAYSIKVPHWRGPKVAVDQWEISGTVFHGSGLPFSITDSNTVPSNYGGTLFANQLDYNFSHTCAGSSAAGIDSTGNAKTCALAASVGGVPVHFAKASSFGTQHRNQFTGPGFTDTDMAILKGFTLPWYGVTVKVGAQFFNLLNHPNFAQPSSDISSFGNISSTVSTPTSILGAFLGGDASPRIIELTGKLYF